MNLQKLLSQPPGKTFEFKRDLSSLKPILKTLVIDRKFYNSNSAEIATANLCGRIPAQLDPHRGIKALRDRYSLSAQTLQGGLDFTAGADQTDVLVCKLNYEYNSKNPSRLPAATKSQY